MLPWKTPREETMFDNLMLPPVSNICYALIFFSNQYKSITVKPSTRNDNNDLSEQPKHLPVQPLLPNKLIFHLHLKRRKWRGILSGMIITCCSTNCCSKTKMESFSVKVALRFPQKMSSWKAGVWTRTALRTNIQEAWWKLEACCMHEGAWKKSCFSVK